MQTNEVGDPVYQFAVSVPLGASLGNSAGNVSIILEGLEIHDCSKYCSRVHWEGRTANGILKSIVAITWVQF